MKTFESMRDDAISVFPGNANLVAVVGVKEDMNRVLVFDSGDPKRMRQSATMAAAFFILNEIEDFTASTVIDMVAVSPSDWQDAAGDVDNLTDKLEMEALMTVSVIGDEYKCFITPMKNGVCTTIAKLKLEFPPGSPLGPLEAFVEARNGGMARKVMKDLISLMSPEQLDKLRATFTKQAIGGADVARDYLRDHAEARVAVKH
jgi:hypothetical protein